MSDGSMAEQPSDRSAADRAGIIQVNNLVYKLDTDLSVAVNRTFKNGYFQNNQYTNGQTSIAIFNSGADYIDPRRSFLSMSIQLPTTQVPASPDPLASALISGYFGPNGSVLNLIDSVIIQTRSGDELSRINDYAQLMYTWIPLMFGKEWRSTVGQLIGLGSYLGGLNSNGVLSGMYRESFHIPLYLLSPVFSYGRLLPSMLMSGLRVEIKWKNLADAVQQFWENCWKETPSNLPEIAAQGRTNGQVPLIYDANTSPGALDASHNLLQSSTWTWNFANATIACNQAGITAFNSTIAATEGFPSRPYWQVGDKLTGYVTVNGLQQYVELRIMGIDASQTNTLFVNEITTSAWITNNFARAAFVFSSGPWRERVDSYDNTPVRAFGAKINRGNATTPVSPLTGFDIINPIFRLCSIQLSDAVQRTLNEISSVNGLEIVYADWDRTSNPIDGLNVGVSTEVRKACSRALQTVAVVTHAESGAAFRDSFASYMGGVWNHWQWQLGSLYFPQQRVEDNSSVVTVKRDNMLSLSYAYVLDAFDRLQPKAAPTMLSLRGEGLDAKNVPLATIENYEETNPDHYLVPSFYTLGSTSVLAQGKRGSFANGAYCVGTTLERSTIFDLSGIPINNSRILALRGEYSFPVSGQGLLYIFLRYVRLARVFLLNVEVEQ